MKKYNMGLDVGSTTVKLIVLDGDENIVYSEYRRHFSDIRSTIINLIKGLMMLLGSAKLQ